MPNKKVTIALDESLVDAMADTAREEGVPLSRLVASAAERELRLRASRAVVQEWQAEHGGFTPEELASARAEIADADVEYLGTRWRKSSHSNQEGGDCVEVADGFRAVVPVRDSKVPQGPVLCFDAASWSAFIAELKAGQHRP